MMEKSVLSEKDMIQWMTFSSLKFLLFGLEHEIETCELFLYLIIFFCVSDFLQFTAEQFKLNQLFSNPPKSLHYHFRF